MLGKYFSFDSCWADMVKPCTEPLVTLDMKITVVLSSRVPVRLIHVWGGGEENIFVGKQYVPSKRNVPESWIQEYQWSPT
jgi:hypothetical protein